MNFCEVANQPGDRVHPNEQRGDSGSLTNMRPLAKQQQGSEKYSAAGPSKPREKSEACSDTYRHRSRRRKRLRRIAAAKEESCGGEKQGNPDQNPQNRGRRLQIAAEIGGRNRKQRERPEKFPRKMTGPP